MTNKISSVLAGANHPARHTEYGNSNMKRERSIHIGEIFVGKSAEVVYTVLGSCVAVCLFDPVARVGGINHILLPGKATPLMDSETACKYGQNAIDLLVGNMHKLGAALHRMQAKIFGGARMFASVSSDRDMGRKNAIFTFEYLQQIGIPIAAQDLGGCRSRRVYFHTDTGEVFVNRISNQYTIGKNTTKKLSNLSTGGRLTHSPWQTIVNGGNSRAPIA